ncbi:hypothetical protein GCM10010411_75880 [Actinomadura fulvescens]|uniref:Uncharacterized protein n=1 Tax=Actinomadura fulvescens TaxID=46160 RepID=A0ABN3QIS2_9ACTN
MSALPGTALATRTPYADTPADRRIIVAADSCCRLRTDSHRLARSAIARGIAFARREQAKA